MSFVESFHEWGVQYSTPPVKPVEEASVNRWNTQMGIEPAVDGFVAGAIGTLDQGTASSGSNIWDDLAAIGDLEDPNASPGPEDFENHPLGSGMAAYFAQELDNTSILQTVGRELVARYGDAYVLDHNDVGGVLLDLKHNDKLTDLEKAYVFSYIAGEKGALGLATEDGPWFVTEDGARDAVIDSDLGNSGGTAAHTVVPFWDGYHARLGGEAGDNGQAEMEIASHEQGIDLLTGLPLIGTNPGDEEASLTTVDAFRAYREGGFDAYADSWVAGMLEDPSQAVIKP